jgi:ATP-dependent Zn protease
MKLKLPPNCIDVTEKYLGTVTTLIGAEVFRKQISRMGLPERRAYHESGHAVAAIAFGIPIIRVTVNADAGHLYRGYYSAAGIGLECMVTMCMAGGASEEYFCGAINGSDRIDIEMARRYLARRFDPLQIEVEIEHARAAAGRLVREQEERIRLIADALLQRGTLSGADIAEIIPATLT